MILKWLVRVNQWHDKDSNSNRLMNMIIILFGPWFLLIGLSLFLKFQFPLALPLLWIGCIGIIRILWIEGFLNKYL